MLNCERRALFYMKSVQVFNRGCCTYLTEPQAEDLAEWSSWFNNPLITQNLGNHEGKYHSKESQFRYWQDETAKGRLFAIARNVSAGMLGVLTSYELSPNNSFVSIVFPKVLPGSPFAALESTSLFVEYLFNEFNFERISVGQRYPSLKSWSQRLFLIGFQYEGLEQSGFSKTGSTNDIVRMGITRNYFNLVKSERGGTLWPNDAEISGLMNRLDKALNEEIGMKSLTEYFAKSVHASLDFQTTLLESLK